MTQLRLVKSDTACNDNEPDFYAEKFIAALPGPPGARPSLTSRLKSFIKGAFHK